MIEQTLNYNLVFGSLADATRRDMLRRVAQQELSISELAKPYTLTFAAVSKHLQVLERAKLIVKRRRGKEQIVQLAPAALEGAEQMLSEYRALWDARYDRLEALLTTDKSTDT